MRLESGPPATRRTPPRSSCARRPARRRGGAAPGPLRGRRTPRARRCSARACIPPAASATRRSSTARDTGWWRRDARPDPPDARVRAARPRRHARTAAAVRVFNGMRCTSRCWSRSRPTPPCGSGPTPVSRARAARSCARTRAAACRARARDRGLEHWRETLAAAGLPDDTYLWWDVRLHPRLGTVEVREMDAQSSLEDVAALAALVRALALEAAEAGSPRRPERDAGLVRVRRRARRHGREVLDGRQRPLRDVAREIVQRVRPSPASSATKPSWTESRRSSRRTAQPVSAQPSHAAECRASSARSRTRRRRRRWPRGEPDPAAGNYECAPPSGGRQWRREGRRRRDPP